MMIEKDNCVANKKRNVYWFLIDGLSPQHLAICGNNRVKPNYFDEILGKGIVFSQVISTAGGTHCSMHSQFSSLMPSVNGAVGWVLQSYRNFDKNIMTVADYFKLDGYDTFFYCDCEKERALPTTGFDVWETGNHVIGEALYKTDMMSTIRRECFIGEVIRDEKPKFVYYHSLLLHELNGRLGTFWPHEVYENNIATVAENFRDMIRAFHVTNEDIVIISSDHGVGLDSDYLRDGEIYGERHTEESAICLWSIIGLSDKHPKVLPDMISALDLAPTLLHLVLGKKIPSQGTDRYEYIKKGKYEPYPCFREKGTWTNLKLRDCFHSDVFYVREKNWKYVYSMTDVRSEWLMDLDADGDYVSNLKDDYKDKVAYFRNLIELNIKKYDWRELYRHAGTKKASLVLESELLYFSVVFFGKTI